MRGKTIAVYPRVRGGEQPLDAAKSMTGTTSDAGSKRRNDLLILTQTQRAPPYSTARRQIGRWALGSFVGFGITRCSFWGLFRGYSWHKANKESIVRF